MKPRHFPFAVTLVGAAVCTIAQVMAAAPSLNYAPATQIKITDTFWKPLLDRNRAVTIPHNLRMCREVGVVANFERVAGLRDDDYHGLPNWDEFLYKAIEAACYGLRQRPDPELEKELDDLIAVLARAQDADGYLRTVIQLSERGRGPANLKRWSNLGDNLELYCAGHLFEAGVAHFQATGKRSLLAVALKNAELIDHIFGPGKRADVCGHQEIEPALVRLYEATDDDRWWKLAKFFVDTRGTEAGGRSKRGEFSQDHAPLFEQVEAVGQAPRATYFYSGAADVGRLMGDPYYHTALRRLWEDVVTRKLYLNGGIGSRHDNEGFGPPYELPSRTAYTEVCAAVSFPMWATRMFRVEPDAGYFDVIERTLYNNLAAGVSLSGDRYFYACPLESDGKYRFNLGWLPANGQHLPHAEASATRKEWFPCACCPPTLARYLPQVPGFAYATRGNELFVNLFIAGAAEIEVGGAAWKLEQEGNYPWDGRAKLKLNTENPSAKLETIFVRIPCWARNEPVPGDLYRFADHAADAPALAVNGRPVELRTVVTNGFARLARAWRSGDVIELDLPMPVRHVVAHPDVKDCAGKVALQRGPIVYCFEGADHDGRVLDLAMSGDAVFAPHLRDNLLGGTTVLEGELMRAGEPIRAIAIPYHLWSNRGAGEMTVWLDTVPPAQRFRWRHHTRAQQHQHGRGRQLALPEPHPPHR
ncbi:MAG: glycoside hydrolase family 127 protein [Verrucomicrobia bacterium]|nr:glycoside hydrolase family 127 protein [Verrucomicrobiota bacterium]